MGIYEVIYAEKVEGEDFFDAIEKLKNDDREILSVSQVSLDDEDVFD